LLNSRKSKLCFRVASLLTLFLIAILLPSTCMSRSVDTSPSEFRLRLLNTHTGQHLDIVYRIGDQYLPEALDRLDYFLRDHRTGDVRHYDPRVFDLLHDLVTEVGGADHEIDVLCGYRTLWSNEYLRNLGRAVARHSLHMQAMAIDIRIPGVETAALRDAALALHEGGVGYYASSAFVHVDVGPVRRW